MQPSPYMEDNVCVYQKQVSLASEEDTIVLSNVFCSRALHPLSDHLVDSIGFLSV